MKLVTGARHSIGGSSAGSKVNLLVKETSEAREAVTSSKQTVARLTAVADKLVTSSIVRSSNNDGKSGHSFTSDNLLDDHHSDQLIEYTTTTDTPRLSSAATTAMPLSSVAGTAAATTQSPAAATTAGKAVARKHSLASLYDARADELTRNSDSNPLSRGASRSMGSRRIPIKKLVASALREQEYLVRSTTTTTTTTTTAPATAAATTTSTNSSSSSSSASASPLVTQRPRASSLTAVSRAIDRIRPRKRVPSQPPVPAAPIRLVMSTTTTTTTTTTSTTTTASPTSAAGEKDESSSAVSSSSRLASQAVTDANESDQGSGSSSPSSSAAATTTTTTHSPAMLSAPPSDLFNRTSGSASGHSSRIIHSLGDKNSRKNDLSLPSALLSSEMRRTLTPATRAGEVKISSSLRESTATRDPVSTFSSSVRDAPATTVRRTINTTTTGVTSPSSTPITRNTVNKLQSSPILQAVSLQPRVTSTNGRGQDVPSIRKNLVTVLTVTSDKFVGKYGSSDEREEENAAAGVEEDPSEGEVEETVEKVEPISDEDVSDELAEVVSEEVNDEASGEREEGEEEEEEAAGEEEEEEGKKKERTSSSKASDVARSSGRISPASVSAGTTPVSRVTWNSADNVSHVDISGAKKSPAVAAGRGELNVTRASLSPVTIVTSDSDDESNIDQENNDNIPSNVIGVAGIDYPIYADIPRTDFDCRNAEYPGFYADQQTGCQVYHSCGSRGGRRHSFICPNGTIFSQEYLICDWWFNVRCSDSHNHFSLNKEAFSSPIKSSAVSTSTSSSSSTTSTSSTSTTTTTAAAAASSSTVSSTVTVTPVASSTS